MGYGAVPLQKRLKENIRNYGLSNLLDPETLKGQMRLIYTLTGLKTLLTDRHGEKMAATGNFASFTPDVVGEPGRKLRVANRTIAHIYVRDDEVPDEKRALAEELLETLVLMWEDLAGRNFVNHEYAVYIDEMEREAGAGIYQTRPEAKEDVLTGVFNKNYYEEREKALDESGVVPIAAIEANINDWKYANDHYGDEESDRLIQSVARIIREEAGEDYVIGRVDGDVFHIAIPAPGDGEAEDYIARIQRRCSEYEDERLTLSVAAGLKYKTNVEETLADLFEEAQYAMFENKFEIKQDPEYRARLHRNEK